MKKYGKINILGTWYNIINQTEAENPKLFEKDGMCERYSKEIVIDTSFRHDREACERIDDYFHFVLRHEALHAIFHEIGHSEDYSCDEQLINILAQLYPKIKPIMDALDKIDFRER